MTDPGHIAQKASSMTIASDLTRDGKLVAAAITACTVDAAALGAALSGAETVDQQAALAIVAGLARQAEAVAALVPLLAKDGLAGRAAAWALARIPGAASEQAVIAAITSGGLDQRENGYWSLTTRVALGNAGPALADAMVAQVAAEIAKAKAGGSGLVDHACRVLAVLGDKRTGDLAQQAMEADRFCDRFELNRLRKSVTDGGRDTETSKERQAEWTVLFADHLAAEVKPEPSPVVEAKGAATTVHDGPPSYDMGPNYGAGTPAGAAVAGDAAGEVGEGEGEPPSQAKPVDWKAFAISPEAMALPAPLRQMTEQLGKMLDQFATKAVGVPLADLAGQEFAALLLQVLPQALPPQHVQAALSPQAMNGYQALARFLVRTGAATNGAELVEAVKAVRKQMQEQVRRAGILNGPDYSDPEDKKPLPA